MSQPAHGTVSNFNASTGHLHVHAGHGFHRERTAFSTRSRRPARRPLRPTTVSNPGTVTFLVGARATPGPRAWSATSWSCNPVPQHGSTPRTRSTCAQVPDASSPTGESSSRLRSTACVDQTVEPGSARQPDHRLRRQEGQERDRHRSERDNCADDHRQRPRHSSNRLTGGSAQTREHGWFGHTTLIGGTGPESAHRPGRPRQVQANQGDRRSSTPANSSAARSQLNPVPPGGTFYKFVHGHLVPIPATVFKAPRSFKSHKLEN